MSSTAIVQSIAPTRWRAVTSTLTSRRVVCHGNSLTAGQGASGVATRYPSVLATITGHTVVNVGTGAHTTPLMIDEAADDVDPYAAIGDKRPIYVAWELMNDLYVNSVTPTVAVDNMQTLCLGRRARGFVVVALDTLGSVNYSGTWSAENRALVNAEFAARWRNFADAAVLISAIPQLDDGNNDTYFTDGLHCTDAGYALVAAAVAHAIDNEA